MIKSVVTLAATAFLMLVGAADLHAQRAVVMEQLEAAQKFWADKGLATDVTVFGAPQLVGLLKPKGEVVLEIKLEKDVSYAIVGGCDGDCTDMNLVLFSGDGTSVLHKDVGDDDVPVLRAVAKETGPHLLAVFIPGCSEAYCFFGVRVFKKN